MFSKRSRTATITRGLPMAVGAVSLHLKTREKKIAPLRKKNRTGSTTQKEWSGIDRIKYYINIGGGIELGCIINGS